MRQNHCLKCLQHDFNSNGVFVNVLVMRRCSYNFLNGSLIPTFMISKIMWPVQLALQYYLPGAQQIVIVWFSWALEVHKSIFRVASGNPHLT